MSLTLNQCQNDLLDGANITGNSLPDTSAVTWQISLNASNDANLELFSIAVKVCKVQFSSKRRVKYGSENKLNKCMSKIRPLPSEIKPGHSDSGKKTRGSKPSSKPPEKKIDPFFYLTTVPSFSSFHFRENKFLRPHKYTTIPVYACHADKRDWATSTSASFYTSLLECVTCICPYLQYLQYILFIKVFISMLIILCL